MKTVVVAFGGNALWPRGGTGLPAEQIQHARHACAPLVELLRKGTRLLLVYGNGPQVGAELLRHHAARAEVAPSPLDVCVAATQGSLGYLLELALRMELSRAGIDRPVTAVSSLVLVDPEDPAFAAPDKPVGPYYHADEARRLREQLGWKLAEQVGGGFRRVVASPRPLELIDAAAVYTLLEAGHIVLAGGGGGVPVARLAGGGWLGLEAVIDKDRTAAMLGRAVGARELVEA
ncbi:MAG TPA: carbamate kinase, partial [Kofleriaceae bacterium]|nr:carbamate kinase [Kofleriaceae bacterium]